MNKHERRIRQPAASPILPQPIGPESPERPVIATEKRLAAVILFLWGAAITAGRLTAYDDAHAQSQTALGTLVVTAVLLAVHLARLLVTRRPRAVRWIAPVAALRRP